MVLILFRCVPVKAWVVLSWKYRVAMRFVVVMAAGSGFWCSGVWYSVLPSTRLLIHSFDSFVRFSLVILFRWAIDVKLSAFDMRCIPFWLGPLEASLAAWSAFSFPAIFTEGSEEDVETYKILICYQLVFKNYKPGTHEAMKPSRCRIAVGGSVTKSSEETS
jgi:hypothetical protein